MEEGVNKNWRAWREEAQLGDVYKERELIRVCEPQGIRARGAMSRELENDVGVVQAREGTQRGRARVQQARRSVDETRAAGRSASGEGLIAGRRSGVKHAYICCPFGP